ncbi:MAG: hypothetical protein ACFFD8_06510 [Candidatus Thorarchaeota archaeon]
MTIESWQEPKPTIDQVRKLVERIQSYVRTSRIMGMLSTVLLLVLMIQLGILVYTNFMPIFWGTPPLLLPDWFYYVLMITFALSMVIYGVAGTINGRLNRYLLEYKKIGVVVQLRCEACNRHSERVWEKDDFIFKEEGICACGGKQFISQMYIMPLPLKKKDSEL